MSSQDARTFASSARLIGVAEASSLSRDDLLKRARDTAADPDIVEEFVPWFFGCRMSTDALDSWGTEMDITTLRNYAGDARTGVTVLDTHNVEHVIGRTLDGRYVEGEAVGGTHTGQGTGKQRAEAVFAILSGQRTATGMLTDDYINQIRFGSYKDVSVGFTLPKDAYIHCNVCGKRMNEWFTDEGCYHFPGMWMDSAEGERIYATGRVVNAGLSELSPVYDGATPGAEVMPFAVAKAYDMEDADALDRATAERLTQRYNVRFRRAVRKPYALGGVGVEDTSMTDKTGTRDEQKPDGEQADPAGVPAGTEEQPTTPSGAEGATPPVDDDEITVFPDDEEDEELEPGKPLEGDEVIPGAAGDPPAERLSPAQIQHYRAKYKESGIRFGADAVDALMQRIGTLTEDRKTLRAKVQTMTAEAEAGKRYRESLITDTLTQAKRAHAGEAATFDEDGLRARLDRDSNSVEDLEFWRDHYLAAATARFGKPADSAGGRLLPLDDGQPGEPEKPKGRRKGGPITSLLDHGDE